MKHHEVTLEDKYNLEQGQAFMTGIQALVRLPLDRKRLDRTAGLNTAGFISGYRGSPLGGYDNQLRAVDDLLKAHDITLWEGLNEDLGATAVWGSQQTQSFPGARYAGVFGIWYGKAPGVDRTGDVFKHANFAGTSPNGGVLAIVGDDHNCKSSTLPSQSEYALMDAEMPVLNPASIQDVLDYGLHGWAMSRFSGLWVGMVALADTMDSGAVVDVSASRLNMVLPTDFARPGGVHLRVQDSPLEKERRLREIKLPAALAYARANRLDQTVLRSGKPRLGLVVTGQAARDVFEALAAIGLSPDAAADLGVSVYKVAMPWPLEPQGLRAFCAGHERILVIEHKRPLIEDQLRAALYDLPDSQRPLVEGKTDLAGAPLLSRVAAIAIPELARALYDRITPGPHADQAQAYFAKVGQGRSAAAAAISDVQRSPHFCSGCPHNTSTVVPEGSRALAGIGCHYMANFMPERRTNMTSQMGGEGISWIGQAPFTDEDHVFVNLGDGTYSHSGSLAIRAALTGKVNVTYKILYNDAVAMTGGQSVESGQTVPQITRQLAAEGVKTAVVVADDPSRYAHVTDLARGVQVFPRAKLEEVQLRLRETPGVSVLIYDQVCATEKRRRIKRGLMKAPTRRAFINAEVCEGCGDCSLKSNCLSIEPLETEKGRKRQINQSSCNQDMRCLDGFCPSFVTVTGAGNAKRNNPKPEFDATGLDLPEPITLERPWNIVFTGVGGTGVTTVAAIIAMAAHIDGNASTTLDMTGLAQKYGPVFSYVRVAKTPADITAGRVPPAAADALIACDLVVAASGDALVLLDKTRTRCVANHDVTPTAQFVQDRTRTFEADLLASRVAKQVSGFSAIEAEALAEEYLYDAIFTNMVMLGFAWQKGLVPVTLRAVYRALKLNSVAIEANMQAFDLGRLAAVDPDKVRPKAMARADVQQDDLDTFIAKRERWLIDYQDPAYAARYRALVDRVRTKSSLLGLDEAFSRAVATYAYKLMAYKDEYEVARLYTSGTFAKSLRETFSGKFKIQMHLAPPLLAKKDRHGHLIKQEYGGWMLTAFAIMRRFKGLRGGPFDLFGYTAERKMERALRDEYLARIDTLLATLSPTNAALATEIASLPDTIRGFGHVKEASVQSAQATLAGLMGKWNGTAEPGAKKTTLIGA